MTRTNIQRQFETALHKPKRTGWYVMLRRLVETSVKACFLGTGLVAKSKQPLDGGFTLSLLWVQLGSLWVLVAFYQVITGYLPEFP